MIDRLKNDWLFRSHFGKHPVIYADFSSIYGTDYDSLRLQWHSRIVTACMKHEYILRNASLWSGPASALHLKYFLEQYFRFKSYNEVKSMKDVRITNAFFDLSWKLYEHFGEKVVVLIDEVDAPTSLSLYIEKFSSNEIKDIDRTLKTLLRSICKRAGASNYIEKVVVTSILSLSTASSREPVNLKGHHFLQDKRYERLFGFTRTEVEQKIQNFNTILREKMKERYDNEDFLITMTAWYDGYNSCSGVSIYNPWSIVNFITTFQFKTYWATRLNQENFIHQVIHPQILPTIWRLMNREVVVMITTETADENINLPTLIIMREILLEGKVSNPCPFFKYLCENGFLSCHYLSNDKISMKIPNYEIFSKMDSLIFSSEQATALYAISPNMIVDIGETFIELAECRKEKHVKTLANKLSWLHRAMNSTLNTRDKRMIEDFELHFVEDNFKHALFVILKNYFSNIDNATHSVRKEVLVKSDTKTKGGRIDLLLTTHGVTFIIELKYHHKSAYDSKAAIKQCIDNGFNDILKTLANPGDHYILLGIRFNTKNHIVDISYLFDSIDSDKILTVSSVCTD